MVQGTGDYACVQVSIGGGLDFDLRQAVYVLAICVGNMERLVSHPYDSTGGDSELMVFSVDVWSIGCIFAELLLGKPLFKGKE